MSESVEMLTVGALPGTLFGICVMRMSHFDGDGTFHAPGGLTVHDVLRYVANVSS